MENLQKYKEFFSNDKFATEATSCEILTAQENYAKVSMKIQPKHINGAGTVMGGAIFTLADFAFAVATNPCKPQTVTTTSQITYLSVAKGSTLYAETRLIKDGRSTCFYEIEVTDDLGTKVAFVTVSGMKISK